MESEERPDVDILSIYYQQKDVMPFYIKSVELNRDHIANCIVVTDGGLDSLEIAEFMTYPGMVQIFEPDGCTDLAVKTSQWEEDWPPLYVLTMSEKPEGSFRVSEALNIGFHFARSEYVHTTSFDSIMQPGCIEIEKQFATPRKVLVGAMHHVNPDDVTVDSFPDNVPITRPDWKPALHQMFDRCSRQWLYCHNSHNLWHVPSVLKIGGFDDSCDHLGRTTEDHEFAARWLLNYGSRSIFFGPTFSWNLSDRTGPDANKREGVDAIKRPTMESRKVLARTLGKLYDQQYYLFADIDNQPIYSHVQCLPDKVARICDVRVDCINLDWMEEGKVKDIVAIVGHQYTPGDRIEEMVNGMYRALKPWGRIRLVFPADPIPGAERPVWVAAAIQAGFEIEQLPEQVLVACKVAEDDE